MRIIEAEFEKTATLWSWRLDSCQQLLVNLSAEYTREQNSHNRSIIPKEYAHSLTAQQTKFTEFHPHKCSKHLTWTSGPVNIPLSTRAVFLGTCTSLWLLWDFSSHFCFGDTPFHSAEIQPAYRPPQTFLTARGLSVRLSWIFRITAFDLKNVDFHQPWLACVVQNIHKRCDTKNTASRHIWISTHVFSHWEWLQLIDLAKTNFFLTSCHHTEPNPHSP